MANEIDTITSNMNNSLAEIVEVPSVNRNPKYGNVSIEIILVLHTIQKAFVIPLILPLIIAIKQLIIIITLLVVKYSMPNGRLLI